MECAILREQDPRWDEFVTGHPAGTFFHLAAWRDILARSFGHEPIYLYVEDSRQLRGVLPLFLVKSLLFGRSLVAMPVGVYGGILAADAPAGRMLLEAAIGLARDQRVRYCRYTNRLETSGSQ